MCNKIRKPKASTKTAALRKTAALGKSLVFNERKKIEYGRESENTARDTEKGERNKPEHCPRFEKAEYGDTCGQAEKNGKKAYGTALKKALRRIIV